MKAGAEQVLAFRLARLGLAGRDGDLPGAAACPASDFSRDAALLALGARCAGLTRDSYLDAVERGEVVVGHVVRGAIHALAPADHALWGRALIAADDGELTAQLGEQVRRLVAEGRFVATEALEETAGAIHGALDGQALGKNDLHEELRGRVREELMPWCEGCGSHHVAPMLWRYGTVKAGARLDSERRYVLGDPGPPPPAGDAVRRFLGYYGPAEVGDFVDWAGVAKPQGRRLWDEVADELVEVSVDGKRGWLPGADAEALESPPTAKGIRFLPPGDPYLQKPNRALPTPDAALRQRLFRPVSSPGAVLRDGRVAGLWKAKLKGRKAEVTVEPLERLRPADLEDEAQRVAQLRGAAEAKLAVA